MTTNYKAILAIAGSALVLIFAVNALRPKQVQELTEPTNGGSQMDCLNKFLNFNFDVKCILKGLTRFLSYFLIVGAALVKVPQIIKIIKKSSVEGIARSSIYLDVLSSMLTSGYNIHLGYPFRSYGEYVVVGLQTVILVALCWKYDKTTPILEKSLVSLGIFTGVSLIYLDLVPQKIYMAIFGINLIVSFASKVPQIHLNWKNQSTGQLSVITYSMTTFGFFARVLTSLADVKDLLILVKHAQSLILNSFIMIQFALYRKNDKSAKVKGEINDGKGEKAKIN